MLCMLHTLGCSDLLLALTETSCHAMFAPTTYAQAADTISPGEDEDADDQATVLAMHMVLLQALHPVRNGFMFSVLLHRLDKACKALPEGSMAQKALKSSCLRQAQTLQLGVCALHSAGWKELCNRTQPMPWHVNS